MIDHEHHRVSRKRVKRLMRLMGITTIYRSPHTSKPSRENKVYPYLLRGLEVNRVNQVWGADITYIPMAHQSPIALRLSTLWTA